MYLCCGVYLNCVKSVRSCSVIITWSVDTSSQLQSVKRTHDQSEECRHVDTVDTAQAQLNHGQTLLITRMPTKTSHLQQRLWAAIFSSSRKNIIEKIPHKSKVMVISRGPMRMVPTFSRQMLCATDNLLRVQMMGHLLVKYIFETSVSHHRGTQQTQNLIS